MRRDGADEEHKQLTFLQTAGSVLAAMIGVQKQKHRERDFERGNPVHFILVGVLMTAVFLLIIFGVVRLILALAS